jgi:HAD superfamily hydrolase (TIGR01549 family)
MKVLIFDFDGTIADTLKYGQEIANKLAEEFHFNKVKDWELPLLKQKSTQELIKYLEIPILKLPRIISRAHQELHLQMDDIEPITGLKEILLELKKLVHTMGILTSNSKKNVEKFLQNHELSHVFDFIDSSPRLLGKSHQIKSALKQHDLKRKDVIYIGDETRDVEATKKAKVRMAAVTWGFNSSEKLSEFGPDFVVDEPKQLLQLCAEM